MKTTSIFTRSLLISFCLILIMISSCHNEPKKNFPMGPAALMASIQQNMANIKACNNTLKKEFIGTDLLGIKGQSGAIIYEVGQTYGKVRLNHLKLLNKSLPPPKLVSKMKIMNKRPKHLKPNITDIVLSGKVSLYVAMEIREAGKSNIELTRKVDLNVLATTQMTIKKCIKEN